MKHILTSVLVGISLSITAPLFSRAQNETSNKPCQVRKIYISALGDSTEAERFRMELVRQLRSRQFSMAERAEGAEAVLSGQVSFGGSEGNGKLAFEQGELGDATGSRLWQGNFHFTRVTRASLRKSGNLKDAASKVAANLGEPASNLRSGKEMYHTYRQPRLTKASSRPR